ncbi:hypothetical protein [Bradyrhizobium sp. BR 1433]|uniref:hypothetical protein n=1 Tax=Bradyrhizobium sp. BR 1433 TaxID=3447967 RepID=UPI003EE71879
MTAGRKRITTNDIAISAPAALIAILAASRQRDDLPIDSDVGVARSYRGSLQVIFQRSTISKYVSVSTSSTWAGTSAPARPSDRVTSISGSCRAATIATITDDGVSTWAAFCCTVLSIRPGIAAAPTGTLSYHHALLAIKGPDYG